jgi:hypothetical protein
MIILLGTGSYSPLPLLDDSLKPTSPKNGRKEIDHGALQMSIIYEEKQVEVNRQVVGIKEMKYRKNRTSTTLESIIIFENTFLDN